ncbi:MAG: hypothetical protein GY842_08765 [bacterium]|nr:hypothetical protein [bacterium]
MGKTKKGPALFELMRGGDQEAESAEQTPASSSSGSAPSPPQSSPEPVRSSLGAGSPTPPAGGEALCEVVGGRIRLSLTQAAATIVVALAVAGLSVAGIVGYRLGKREGKELGRLAVQQRVVDEIEQARRSEPTANLFKGIGVDPTSSATAAGQTRQAGPRAQEVSETGAGSPGAWVQGYNYIVVQDFKLDAHADVIQARAFLGEKGIAAVILELESSGTYRYRLLTATGFDLEDPVQKRLADGHLAKVRGAGREYAAGGGRHNFATAYFKKLTGDRW